MAREKYEEWRPGEHAQSIVRLSNEVLADLSRQGYIVTLRQLYYQLVTKNYIPNNTRSYDNLGAIINRARLAGLMDWDYLEDRGRNLQGGGGFDDPAGLISVNQYQYGVRRWEGQQFRVEVWVEKEALVSVIGRSASRLDVPYFACKGYVSQSEMHAAAHRHIAYANEDGHEQVYVIHLGDHDPSGLDMSRDIQDRLSMFGANTEVVRIALNRDQVDAYNPPPNPAKITDSRAKGYIAEHGRSSWELDALTPSVLDSLITDTIRDYLDTDLYNERVEYENEGVVQMQKLTENWEQVAEVLGRLPEPTDSYMLRRNAAKFLEPR